MHQPLNVLVVHGIGEQPVTFADKFERVLSGHVRRLVGELTARYRLSDASTPRVLNVIPGRWAPVLEGIFQVLESRLFAGHTDRMRAFAMRFMGDVIAYQGPAVYEEIHRALGHALRSRLSPESRHLTIVAHSLGSVIASDFVYDHTRRTGTRFRDHFGVDFVNFFTLGSPLALYAARSPLSVMDGDGPSRVLKGFDAPVLVESEHGVWVNVYSNDDVVGYPLKPANDAYARAVTADVVQDAGSLWTRWNLLSHGGYWTEPDVITRIAEKLAIDYAELHLGLRNPGLEEVLGEYRSRLAPVKRGESRPRVERAGSQAQGPRS